MDVGKLKATVDLDTRQFSKGIGKITGGFKVAGAGAVKLNQTLELLGRGMRGLQSAAEGTFGTFIKAANTSTPVTKAVLWRVIVFRNRYISDGGQASSGSPSRYR